jgi:hypothetical protein
LTQSFQQFLKEIDGVDIEDLDDARFAVRQYISNLAEYLFLAYCSTMLLVCKDGSLQKRLLVFGPSDMKLSFGYEGN